ncbi:MAG: DEAD/DEAH box helicase [Kiritimatiellae bacterium]|nr:DEAD/DEAH box helicase [Kiritimatiellia bacterium]
MFLSDVRERKFKDGIFLGDDVFKAVEDFNTALNIVSSGYCLPCIIEKEDGFYGAWAALGNDSPFIQRVVDTLMRFAKRSVLEGDAHRYDSVHDAWIASLRSDTGKIQWEEKDDIVNLSKQLELWRAPLFISPEERAAIEFTLVEPKRIDGSWIVKISSLPKTRSGLISLGQAATLFTPLKSFRGNQAEISIADAVKFMRVGANLLKNAGYCVNVPEEILGEHIFAEADIYEIPEEELSQKQRKEKQKFFKAKVSVVIDGTTLSEEDLVALLEQDSPFVFFNDHWIEIDRTELKDALRAMRNANSKPLRLRDALSISLGYSSATSLKTKTARAHGWLRGLLNELKGKDHFDLIPAPKSLKGSLRDYQLRGASWIAYLSKYGFGPCLADDMGLGKTIQTIAYILHLKENGLLKKPALIVAPVSVVTNWLRELKRFAPSLKTLLHQGQFRYLGLEFQRQCKNKDVVILGYSLLVKDFKHINNADFSVLILDEAQMIKNPTTHYAKAACALNVPTKIALTGTPVENSPDDLWSIENCLNPGLLGERREFSKLYSSQIETDAKSSMSKKLRHIVEPFILRRMKTDKKIASEIGEKYEVREYCPLTALQRRMYEDALASFKEDINAKEELSGIARRGRMFALLTELKEICDAPELFDEGSEVFPSGGKIARLKDLLESIFSGGESVLIFTQYVRMGHLLRKYIQEVFGKRTPFLHGGLSPSQRDAEIEAFNSSKDPTSFILSLKAGGFGLNLTKATHVIHFDRWWNPAVENQATDRAYRIGQTKTVYVHTFICPGTLEDRIDALLESKRHLVNEIITSGESFLLKMGSEEFERMVKLDG